MSCSEFEDAAGMEVGDNKSDCGFGGKPNENVFVLKSGASSEVARDEEFDVLNLKSLDDSGDASHGDSEKLYDPESRPSRSKFGCPFVASDDVQFEACSLNGSAREDISDNDRGEPGTESERGLRRAALAVLESGTNGSRSSEKVAEGCKISTVAVISG